VATVLPDQHRTDATRLRTLGMTQRLPTCVQRSCSSTARTCLAPDKRITNFGGGNTSAKLSMVDPLTGAQTSVLWVKGSGVTRQYEARRVLDLVSKQA